MKKYRWFLLRMNYTLPEAARELKLNRLGDERSFGFVITSVEEATPIRYYFKYLTKTVVRLQVVDSSGHENEQEFSTLNSISFVLFECNSLIWLRVENPPRSVKDMLNSLELVLGWGFSITSILFSLKSQRTALLDADGWTIVAFKGIGSSAKNKAIARFEVAAKAGVVPEELDFLAGLEFKVEQATYEVMKGLLRGQVAFAATGLVRFSGPLYPFLINAVEQRLHIALRGS